MDRRAFLSGATSSVVITAGCVTSDNSDVESDSGENIDSTTDSPNFEVDNGSPGKFILLRNQPQEPEDIVVGDELEVSIYLGNSGGVPVTGEVTVKLVPPTGSDNSHTDTIVIEGSDEIPPGAARSFIVGPFTMATSGTWELIANSGITEVHQKYDPSIQVIAASSD